MQREAPAAARAARRPSRLRLVQLGLTLAAVAVLVYVVDWSSFLATIASASPGLLALGLLLLVVDRVLMSYKWGLLLAARGAHLPLWENCGIYALVTLVSVLLPATIGGDLIRTGWLWRRGVPASAAAASIALERAVGFAVALAFAGAGLAFLAAQATTELDLEPLLAVTLASFALMLLALFLSFRVPAAWLPQRRVGGLLGGRLAGFLARLHGAYVGYRAQPAVVLAFSALTIAEYLLIILATFVIGRALGIEAGVLYFGAALAVALVIARLPIAIDGIGVFEGAFALLLAWTGVPPAATVALAVCSRVLLLISCAPPAILLLWARPVRLRDLFNPPGR
jgi:uncharacterized protein (TIRG00374 family)